MVTTSYLTHDAVAAAIHSTSNFGYEGPLHISPGRFVGLRLIPMLRDLRFAWEEVSEQLLDERAEDAGKRSRLSGSVGERNGGG